MSSPETHHLRIRDEWYRPLADGRKTYELRSTVGRTFAVGDALVLTNVDRLAPLLRFRVSHVRLGGFGGLEADYAILSLAPMEADDA